jgi:hypothetical protein
VKIKMLFAAAVAAAFVFPGLSTAAPEKPATPPASKSEAKDKHPTFTPEREAAALTFVRMNHPELADLLAQLKSTRPKEYQSAVRELYRVCDRLAQTKDRDPARYELELESWKLRSQIQVLSARGSMTDPKSIESELRTLLARQQDVQLRQLQLDRRRTAERLEKLDESIGRFERRRAAELEDRFKAALRGIERSRAAAEQRRKKASATSAVRAGGAKE